MAGPSPEGTLTIDERGLVTGRVWDVAWHDYPQPHLPMDFVVDTPQDSKLIMRVKGGRRLAFLASSTKGRSSTGSWWTTHHDCHHRQLEHARAYAEGKSWTMADEYVDVDDGISGPTWSPPRLVRAAWGKVYPCSGHHARLGCGIVGPGARLHRRPRSPGAVPARGASQEARGDRSRCGVRSPTSCRGTCVRG